MYHIEIQLAKSKMNNYAFVTNYIKLTIIQLITMIDLLKMIDTINILELIGECAVYIYSVDIAKIY